MRSNIYFEFQTRKISIAQLINFTSPFINFDYERDFDIVSGADINQSIR
jgi:hypothetical protein